MHKRKRIKKSKSRRLFTSKARVKGKNRAGRPMRGGIRL